MIRFLLVLIFVSFFFILSIILLPVLGIIGLFNKPLRDRISFFIVTRTIKLVRIMCGIKLTVIGEENIPKDKAVLFVANHRSIFDIIIAYSLVPNLTGFISKKEVKKVPILAQWMSFMNCLFLDRSNIKEGLKVILEGIEKIKSGISVFIFPEGTRGHVEGQLLEFKEGSLKIASKTGCPVVPVAFNNTSAIFEDQFPRIKKTKVVVEFCKPVEISELTKEESKFLGKYTQNMIQKTIEKNNCHFIS